MNEISDMEVRGLLAQAAKRETLPELSAILNVNENRLLDMIEGKEPLSRKVYRYLGLRREIHYYKVND